MILLLGYGPETPPRKLFLHPRYGKVEEKHSSSDQSHRAIVFSWKPVLKFLVWSNFWSVYVLALCGLCVNQYDGLREMFKRYKWCS